jgi:cobalt-zinc-cadmium efflux system outer membrane protein
MNKVFILTVFFGCFWTGNLQGQQSATPLTLQRVIDTYVQNNLELQSARYRVERTKADQIAARLRPNPGITVTAENLAVSGPTPAGRLYEIGTTYSETIELGGKQGLREKAADATVSAAEAQFEDTMRRGLADVKRLYLDALLARYNVEVTAENRQTFEQLVQFNLTRFQEGAIPEVDLIKVRLERVKFDSSVKQAELNLRQATIRLIERLGTSAGNFQRQDVSGELDSRPIRFDLDSLRQFASTERSDVRAAAAEVHAATQRLALERGRGKPDISPFAGYKRVGSDNTILFGISIPLKLRDHNQAEIARAEADVKMAETRLQIARNHAVAEVEAAYEALQTSRELVEAFENELLRQADESRTITLAAYEEGGTELLPVLEAQRTRTEVRQQYFRTLFDYQASIVGLELAVGREIQP